MNTTKKIQVGLLGYGYAGKTFHAPLIAGTTGMALNTVCSSDAIRVQADWPAVRVVQDPQHLFFDPTIDLVVVATPNDTHFSLGQQALAAKKHLVVDKPFTLTLAEAQELAQKADKAGRLLSVFHNRRWDSDFLTLKKLLKQGTLGEVVYSESHLDRYRPVVRQCWREQEGEGSGLWYDLGPHLLDQALVLFGLPQALYLDLGKLRPLAAAVDYFHCVLSYPCHRVVLHATMLATVETARYIVHGTKGSYVKWGMDPQEESLKKGEQVTHPDFGQDRRDGTVTLSLDDRQIEKPLATERGSYPDYYAAIRDAIWGEGENPVPASQAIDVMMLLELGLHAFRQQKTLPVLAR